MLKESRKITSGTKEWAPSNINTDFGCERNCLYCYAKMMAIRFGRKTEETWKVMEPNLKAINKKYRKRTGRIMFPSSHDITPNNLPHCIIVLQKLLKVGNYVLIVSKPESYCINEIIKSIYPYRNQIEFRFTITSFSKNRLDFWEPNAPSYSDRLNSLLIAFMKGFKTSVSIEPFLDSDPTKVIMKVAPHISNTIWVGKMNYIKANGLSEEEKPFYEYQRRISSWSNIQKIVEKIKHLPEDVHDKIRFKDTIVKMYEKHGIKV